MSDKKIFILNGITQTAIDTAHEALLRRGGYVEVEPAREPAQVPAEVPEPDQLDAIAPDDEQPPEAENPEKTEKDFPGTEKGKRK
jgi:hypothetical protein